MANKPKAAPAPKSDFREVEPPKATWITIKIDIAEARRLQHGMADLLCWVQGFNAACPEDRDRHPMGVEETRRVREKINRELGALEVTVEEISF
ncbi:MAG: hypothetical protein Q8M31_21910 [Beijerinckiaceae bacterium]|nr:hypothetical protein [Beijerinckiaceae bacterium]